MVSGLAAALMKATRLVESSNGLNRVAVLGRLRRRSQRGRRNASSNSTDTRFKS